MEVNNELFLISLNSLQWSRTKTKKKNYYAFAGLCPEEFRCDELEEPSETENSDSTSTAVLNIKRILNGGTEETSINTSLNPGMGYQVGTHSTKFR